MPNHAVRPCNGANGGWCVEFRRTILAHGGGVGSERAYRVDQTFRPLEMLWVAPVSP
jgi:hypothetical protein